MTQQDPNDQLYVVGIGASAGGLEALEKLFTNMPSSERTAFVVVQHLSPDYESHMVGLLSKYANMPVHEAIDGTLVEPANVYLLPRKKTMTIYKGKLYLVDYERDQGINLPIDIFFESLAVDSSEAAIGIVLSGTGSDGTRGIRAIKEMGGLVIAQDDSAKFDGMPRSAVATQLVDFVLAPEEMSRYLMTYVQNTVNGLPKLLDELDTDDDQLSKLLAVLRDQSGIDFSGYKPNTLIRRIERRMGMNQIANLADYIDYLQQSKGEAQNLSKEFLISVTSFFRDPDVFIYIRDNIIPRIFNAKSRLDQIRVWVPGCATGEEAYSLAILFREYIETHEYTADVKIFATDIDKNALDFANRGIYPGSLLGELKPEYISNYFVRRGDSYEVIRHIRSMVVFAYQNLIKDPPFSKMDLITCRNLLIYLRPELQQKAISTFKFALNPNGHLLLGSSENINNDDADFYQLHGKFRVYQYRGARERPVRLPMDLQRTETKRVQVTDYRTRDNADDWRNSEQVLRSIVEHALPPCIIVDENNNVVHAFGDVRKYLQVPVGYRLSFEATKMVREELTLPLSTALHRTFNHDEPVMYQNIQLPTEDGSTEMVRLSTKIIWERNARQRLVMVLLEHQVEVTETSDSIQVIEPYDIDQGIRQRINDLEYELQYTQENLQATIEELETSNEELQATNEELLAVNEELQSTNEELQSVNEELITVNNEYQEKIRELTALNNDIDNLLRSTDIGTIFLDANLHLRKFTPAAQETVNLLLQDIGRPFSHISHKLEAIDLAHLAEQVLATLKPVEQEIRTQQGRWILLRVLPYFAAQNRVDGVVITLVDISRTKAAEFRIRENEERFRYTFDQSPVGAAIVSLDFHFLRVNDKMCEITGYTRSELLTLTFPEITHPDDVNSDVEQAQQLARGEIDYYVMEKRYIRKGGATIWARISVRLVRDENGKALYYLPIVEDITQSIQIDSILKQNEMRYRLLARNLPNIAVLLFDTSMHFMIAEGQLLSRLNLDSVDMEGKIPVDVFTGERLVTILTLEQAVLSGQEITQQVDEEDIRYLVRGVPLFNDEDELFAGMLVFEERHV